MFAFPGPMRDDHDGPVGALVTLDLPDDSPIRGLPWIITFDDDPKQTEAPRATDCDKPTNDQPPADKP